MGDIATALATAAKVVHSKQPIVLMVVQGNERNVSDQRRIEYALWSDHRVKVLRSTLAQVYESGKLDDETNDLVLDGKYRISVIYYRAGYTPNDYSANGEEWKAREIMENSKAIKSPSIAYHLIGSKHFQTVFASKDFLRRYLSESEAERLQAVFVALHCLKNHEQDIIQRAKK